MFVRLGLISFLLFLAPPFAQGAQLSWKGDEKGYYAAYTIKWKGLDGRPQTVSFEVENAYVGKAREGSTKLDANAALQAAYVKAVKEAKRSERRGVTVQVIQREGGLTYRAAGADEHAVDREVARVKRAADKEMSDYLSAHNYALEGNLIEADYSKISRDNYFAMRPLARAIQANTRGKNMREVAEYILSFLQSIPYKTYVPEQGDRMTSIFNTPLRLIADNRGDCDDKSLALGTLLKIMYPSVQVALVFVPGHAFVAIDMPPQSGDTVIQDGGRTYVLAEPVGPALYPLGEIAPTTAALMQQGYTLRQVPDRY